MKKSKYFNKKDVYKALAYLTGLNRLDIKMYKFFYEKDIDLSPVLDVSYNDIIYILFVNKTSREVYDMFNAPSGETKTRPIAWFNTKYNNGKYTESKLGQSGYIPDCINDVIMNSRYNLDEKYELLKESFNALIRIHKKSHGKKKI